MKLEPLATEDPDYSVIGGPDIIVADQPGDCPNFIQWKGTDLCADFNCPCGTHFHIDGMFAHFVRCHGCGQVYQLRTSVVALKFDGVPHIEPQVDIDITVDTSSQQWHAGMLDRGHLAGYGSARLVRAGREYPPNA